MKRSFSEKQLADSLPLLVQMASHKPYCPTQKNVVIDFDCLFYLANENKMEHVLFHFINCPYCKDKTSLRWLHFLEKVRRVHITRQLLFDDQKGKIPMLLEEAHIRGVLFKHHERKTRAGLDVDLLISPDDIEKFVRIAIRHGYTKTKKNIRKELQLYDPRSGYKIDLHHFFAYPQFGDLEPQEYDKIRRFSQELLILDPKKKQGIITLPPHILLFSLTLHFLVNDLLCGLGTLYEICRYATRNEHAIHWKHFKALCNFYDVYHEVLFVLVKGSQVYGMDLPRVIDGMIPFRVRICSVFYTLSDIGSFPPVHAWRQKKYLNISQKKYLNYRIFLLLLRKGNGLMRLLRPRIARFVAEGISKKMLINYPD